MAEEDTKPDVKPDGGETITIALKDQNESLTHFRIKKTTKMKKVIDAYASRLGVQANTFRLLLDGDRVNPDHTPADLDLEDNDQLDVVLEQTGGSSM